MKGSNLAYRVSKWPKKKQNISQVLWETVPWAARDLHIYATINHVFKAQFMINPTPFTPQKKEKLSSWYAYNVRRMCTTWGYIPLQGDLTASLSDGLIRGINHSWDTTSRDVISGAWGPLHVAPTNPGEGHRCWPCTWRAICPRTTH